MVILAAAPLDDIGHWARGSGLEIVFIVTGALLLTRFATWLRDSITAHIDENAREGDAIVRSESAKHRHALAQVLTWSALVIIYCIAVLLVLQRFGVPLAGFVAPATVVGVALGFGAQRVVQDLLAGFFIVTERQYGFGDVVRVNVLGVGTPATGTIEEVTLRVTRLRTLDGEVVMVPNGQIVQVTNLSRDWARAVVDVPVPAGVDVNRVSEALKRVGAAAHDDPVLRPLLLDEPSVMGVESIDVDTFSVRMVARTMPGKQFEVGRALRARITVEFARSGITLSAALDTAGPSGTG